MIFTAVTIISGIFDFVYDMLYKLVWEGLMNFVQLLWDLLIWLTGGTPSEWFSVNILGLNPSQARNTSLLDTLINDYRIRNLYLIMVTIAGTLIVLTIILAVIRSEISADDNVKSKKKLSVSIFKACILTIAMPAIFLFSVAVIGKLVDMLSLAMGEDNLSINNLLIDIGFGKNNSSQHGGWNEFWESFNLIEDWLKVPNPLSNFNWGLIFLLSLICIIILAIALIPLVERLITLGLLIIVSPIVIALYPLDDGNRFGIWKDFFLSKMLSALGIIICLYIYLILCSIFNSIIVNSFLGSFAKITLMIIGLFVFHKGSNIIAQLVGHSTGMADGHSQMSTMHALGLLARGTMGVAGKLSGLGGATAGAKMSASSEDLKNRGISDGGDTNKTAQAMSGATNPKNSIANVGKKDKLGASRANDMNGKTDNKQAGSAGITSAGSGGAVGSGKTAQKVKPSNSIANVTAGEGGADSAVAPAKKPSWRERRKLAKEERAANNASAGSGGDVGDSKAAQKVNPSNSIANVTPVRNVGEEDGKKTPSTALNTPPSVISKDGNKNAANKLGDTNVTNVLPPPVKPSKGMPKGESGLSKIANKNDKDEG